MELHEAMKLLSGGPEGVREWNRRCGSEGVPDFSYASFAGVDLEGASFRQCVFGMDSGYWYDTADFSECKGVRFADFTGEDKGSGGKIRAGR